MSESKESNIIDEAEIIAEKPAEKKQSSHFLLYTSLILIVAVGGWIAYKPDIVLQLKERLLGSQEQTLTTPKESSEVTTQEFPQDVAEEAVEPTEPQTPIFKPAEEFTSATEEEDAPAAELVPYSDLMALNSTIQGLQQQILNLQRTINLIHGQQLEQSQQMVSAQLFTLLQQAATPQLDLIQAATVWKSISFLPLLSDDKRATAQQGHDELRHLYLDIQATSSEIATIIANLSQQLEPEEQAQLEVSTENVSDPYQEVMESNWIDWLKDQFKVTKVDPNTLITPEDPYADTKRLIAELQQLQSSVRLSRWQEIISLNKLFYELEQRGIETTLSHELIRRYEQTELYWHSQAQSWMEQL